MAALQTGLKVPLSRGGVTRCVAAELVVDDGIVIGCRWSALLKARAGMAEALKTQAGRASRGHVTHRRPLLDFSPAKAGTQPASGL